jgi:hypothetical protein
VANTQYISSLNSFIKKTETLVLNSFHYEIFEIKKTDSGLLIKCKRKGQFHETELSAIGHFVVTEGWVKNPKINCEKLRGLPLNEILKIKMKEIGIEESDFLYQQ